MRSEDTLGQTCGFLGKYVNETLSRIATPEGFARTGSGFAFYYNITDHLGNVRATVDGSGGAIQRDDYYPFWGVFNSYVSGTENHYKYQGKEEQDELDTYDFEWRMYDQWLGRTWQMDPLSEEYYEWSPYHWVGNNPLVMIDPSGENWFYYQGEGEEGNSWHWHEGDEATYTDVDGNEQTMNSEFEYLAVYNITGYNREGAAVGTLQLYNQNELVEESEAFTGGGPWHFEEIEDGNYIMRLDIRDSDGPESLNENQDNPVPHYGTQKIPEDGTIESEGKKYPMSIVTAAYGNGRIFLTEVDENFKAKQQQVHGYYLHGKKDRHNFTHGCICDKSEKIFNYFWSGGGKDFRKKVPINVKRN